VLWVFFVLFVWYVGGFVLLVWVCVGVWCGGVGWWEFLLNCIFAGD